MDFEEGCLYQSEWVLSGCADETGWKTIIPKHMWIVEFSRFKLRFPLFLHVFAVQEYWAREAFKYTTKYVHIFISCCQKTKPTYLFVQICIFIIIGDTDEAKSPISSRYKWMSAPKYYHTQNTKTPWLLWLCHWFLSFMSVLFHGWNRTSVLIQTALLHSFSWHFSTNTHMILHKYKSIFCQSPDITKESKHKYSLTWYKTILLV